MNYTGHAAIGILATIGLSSLFKDSMTLPQQCLFIGSSVIGSALPDIDHPESKISKLPIVSSLLKNYYMTPIRYMGTQTYSAVLAQHRGICHSLTACLITTFPFLIFISPIPNSIYFLAGIIIGMFLHILVDSLTPAGIMLFAPFSTQHYAATRDNNQSLLMDNKTPLYIILNICIYILNLIICFLKPLNFVMILLLVLSIPNMILNIIHYDYYSYPDILIDSIIIIAASFFVCFLRRMIYKHLN